MRKNKIEAQQKHRQYVVLAAAIIGCGGAALEAAPINGNWNANASDNWSNAARWSSNPDVPDGSGAIVGLTFNVSSTSKVITIDGVSRTLGILNIGDTNNSNGYTIASDGATSLFLDNTFNSANAQINQVSTSGFNTISAPTVLNSSLDITNASANTLTLSGNITASAGAKTISTQGTGAVTISGGIGSQAIAFSHSGSGNITFSGAAINNLGNLTFSGTGGSVSAVNAPISITGTITNNGTTTGATTLGGAIGSGVSAIVQDSVASSLTISGLNNSTYAGDVTINAGSLLANGGAANVSQLGTGTIHLGATSGSNAAVLNLGNNGATPSLTNPLNVRAGSTGELALRYNSSSGSATYSGLITLDNDLVIRRVGTGTLSVNGGVSGTGDLVMDGGVILGGTTAINPAGTITHVGTMVSGAQITGPIGANVTSIIQNSTAGSLTISGNNASFAGSVDVQAGTVSIAGSNALNASNVVSVSSGATFTIGSAPTIAGLNGAGMVTKVDGATRVLTLGGSGNYDLDGPISNAANTFSILKSGSGTQNFDGNNTYNGTTTVSAGTLLVNGTHTGAGAYSVTGTGVLGGSGTIETTAANGVTLAAGTMLAPGSSPGTLAMNLGTAGVLNISAAVNAAATQSLLFELGLQSDSVVFSNSTGTTALNIGVAKLEFDDFVFTPVAGFGAGTYVLFDGNAAITGTLGTSVTGTIDGRSATLALANAGQDIVLTVVPEPAMVSILGLAVVAGLRRRRA